MAATKQITCKCGCGRTRLVRQADYDRGWGRYYDKSCKARHQESRTRQYARYITRDDDTDTQRREDDSEHPFFGDSLGQWCED